MLKKRWAVVCGVCAAAILVRVTTVGASHLNRVQKERLLEEKLEEYEQLKAEYRELARNNDERAYEVGNQAKDLAVVIGQLEKELGVIPDERLEMEIRSIKAGLMDGLNLAKRGGFSEEYIDAIEQYLQEVEAVEREFSQHTRSNAEIRDELDRLHDKWMPEIDEIYERETGQG